MAARAQHAPATARVHGRRRPRESDRAFGTTFVEFYRLFVLGEWAPVWYRPFIEHEKRASLIRVFQPLLVPGLLQTEEYARTVIAGYGAQPDDLAAALGTRLGRQEILHRESEPCQLVAVIDETVLRRRVGDPALMRDQLKAILSACERPNIRVQVIPADAGAYPGLDGPFVIANVEGRSVGFLEGYLKGRVVESPDDTAELERTWESIRDYALSGPQSLELITRTVETWT